MQYIDLNGPDGNAFALMGHAKNIAKQLGWQHSEIEDVLNDMQSGNYDHLLDVFKHHFGEFVEFQTSEEDWDDYEGDNSDMDGDALASAGFGTDEDYGYYGEDY